MRVLQHIIEPFGIVYIKIKFPNNVIKDEAWKSPRGIIDKFLPILYRGYDGKAYQVIKQHSKNIYTEPGTVNTSLIRESQIKDYWQSL